MGRLARCVQLFVGVVACKEGPQDEILGFGERSPDADFVDGDSRSSLHSRRQGSRVCGYASMLSPARGGAPQTWHPTQ